MNALSSLSLVICYTSAGIGMISVLAPQKRTKRVFSFILGVFVLTVVISGTRSAISEISPRLSSYDIPEPVYSQDSELTAIAQATADSLVSAADELLKNEGVFANDIRISLKISQEGRIYIDRLDIYINESDADKKDGIIRVIYGNFSKEPEIYVD